MNEKTIDKLVSRLQNHKHTIDELAQLFKVDSDEVRNTINHLSDKGIAIHTQTSHQDKSKELYHINILPNIGNVFYISDKDNNNRRMTFGAISDIHFASKYHLPKTFHETMKRFEQTGITRVYVAGDIVDGTHIYKGHLENIITPSIEGQTDIAAEAFAKHPNLEFWGIAGNHDYSFTQQNGAKPLAILESKVDNFKNLGDLRADVVYHGIKIRLLHGASGRAYARSYPSQTYLRDLFGGSEREDISNMPQILIIGHYHTLYNSKDHGIHIIQATSFQDGDNEYCIRKGLTGPNGGYRISLKYKDGIINEFDTKYIQPSVQKKEKGDMHMKNTRTYNK